MKKIWVRLKEEHTFSERVRTSLLPELEAQGFKVECREDPPQDVPDLAICLGGDGTLLSAIRRLGDNRYKVPILGIHTSRGLGFLHSLSIPDQDSQDQAWAQDLVRGLKQGQYTLEPRWGLIGKISELGADLAKAPRRQIWAMNDLVVTKGSSISRMIYLRLKVGVSVLYERMRGDGLIISTATGSTAYSLSAGGPVVHPSLEALVVTPICPHEVAQRPIVLNMRSLLHIEILENKTSDCVLTSDGQSSVEILSTQQIQVECAPAPVHWVRMTAPVLGPKNYFEQLRSKLGYGGN